MEHVSGDHWLHIRVTPLHACKLGSTGLSKDQQNEERKHEAASNTAREVIIGAYGYTGVVEIGLELTTRRE